VLGERADKSLIRTGEESCTVEAVFEPADPGAVRSILEEGGLEMADDGQIILRRVVGQSANRQFINDSPVTLALLKRIGARLVDLHGPHEHQSLLSTERQLAMLDAFAGADAALERYRAVYREWRQTAARLAELREADEAGAHEMDLLRHQIAEIDAAALTAEDDRDLADRWRRASNAARLAETAAAAAAVLGEESGVLDRLAELQRLARDLEKIDPSVAARLEPVESAVLELRELESGLVDYVADLDIDPAAAAALEARVNLIESLKRKYGPTIDDVIARREAAAARLDAIENREDHLAALEASLVSLRAALDEAGGALGKARRKVAPKLADAISSQLADLGFRQSSFEIPLQPLDAPGAHGFESADYLFGPNPGEPMLPLRQIASSGEVSRVMLAVKSALAGQDDTPLMVFDEIDANVGGAVAAAVGRKMAALGERHQVVAITHFPQVAATARSHVVVEKQVVNGRTHSRLRPVGGEARVCELVRMLGGGGAQARAMAEALLAG
jgi:DNA repair protein RecN (Recombination protein N)